MALDCKNCKAPCCRKIGLMLRELDRGDLVCKYLTEDNTCSIYEDRPLICNTDKLYDIYFKDIMTKEKWVQINTDACKKLQDGQD